MTYQEARKKYFEKLVLLEDAVKNYYYRVLIIEFRLRSFCWWYIRKNKCQIKSNTSLKDLFKSRKEFNEKLEDFNKVWFSIIDFDKNFDVASIFRKLNFNMIWNEIKKQYIYDYNWNEIKQNNSTKKISQILRNYYKNIKFFGENLHKPSYKKFIESVTFFQRIRNKLAHDADNWIHINQNAISNHIHFEYIDEYLLIFCYYKNNWEQEEKMKIQGNYRILKETMKNLLFKNPLLPMLENEKGSNI